MDGTTSAKSDDPGDTGTGASDNILDPNRYVHKIIRDPNDPGPTREELRARDLMYQSDLEHDEKDRQQQQLQHQQKEESGQTSDAPHKKEAVDESATSTSHTISSTNTVDGNKANSGSFTNGGGKAGSSTSDPPRERDRDPERDRSRDREKENHREISAESSRHNSSSSLYTGTVSGSATKKVKEKKKPRKKRKSRNTEDDPSITDPSAQSPNNSSNNLRYDGEKGEKGMYGEKNSKSRLDNPKYSSKYELSRKSSGNSSITSSKPGPKKGSKKRKDKESKKKGSAADDDYHHSGRGFSSHRGERDSKKHGINGPGSSPTFRKHKKLKHLSHSGNNSSNVANSNTGSYLDPLSFHPIYSPEQASVNDMMRRALEEDQYSALGSVVDTDSSDEEDYYRDYYASASASYASRNKRSHSSFNSSSQFNSSSNPISGPGNHTSSQNNQGGNSGSGSLPGYSRSPPVPPVMYGMDRTTIQNAMKKRMRLIRANGNSATASISRKRGDGIGGTRMMDFDDARCVVVGKGDEADDQGGPVVGSVGRKKKRKKGKRGIPSKNADHPSFTSDNDDQATDPNISNAPPSMKRNNDTPYSSNKNDASNLYNDDDDVEEEGSIFGQTTGSTNATWVVCDKCEKWRRLRGVVDAKKLPSKWYCSMNKNDPERARCSAPEEAYDTPESATDHRARKHLRLWVRRLQSNEAYEARLPTMTRGKRRTNSNKPSEPYEWVRCCAPSCGKWRAVLKIMDVASVLDKARNGEWYCVLNTWDEKFASCAAPQENLPAIGCPTWVRDDNRGENKVVDQDGYRQIDEK